MALIWFSFLLQPRKEAWPRGTLSIEDLAKLDLSIEVPQRGTKLEALRGFTPIWLPMRDRRERTRLACDSRRPVANVQGKRFDAGARRTAAGGGCAPHFDLIPVCKSEDPFPF